MQNTLYLTADEVHFFDELASNLKEGWEVETIPALHEESPEEIAFRLRMAKVQDRTLNDVITSIRDADDLQKAAMEVDYTRLSPEAMGELFFLFGVRVLTAMVHKALAGATTDEDIEGAAGLSFIRKSLSESNSPS